MQQPVGSRQRSEPVPITASYTYTFNEFRILMRARRERAGRRFWHRYAVLLAIYAVVMAATLWWQGTLDDIRHWSAAVWREVGLIVVSTAAGLALLIAAIDVIFDRLIYRLVFHRYALAGKRIAIELGDEGLAWQAGSLAGRIQWPAIVEMTVTRSGDAAVLWIGKIEGLVLPRSGFATGGEFDAARALARSRIGRQR